MFYTDISHVPTTSGQVAGTSNGISGIIGRARDLLRSNARSVGSTVGRALSYQPKRQRLGHQYGPKIKKPDLKTMEVAVIDYADHEDFADHDGNVPKVLPDYSVGKDDILFSGTVDLMTNDKEDAIRSKLVDVFKSRISELKANDFSFVKVSRKMISTPACKEDHKWGYPQIKAIKGQGKLYVRLDQPLSSLSSALLAQGVSKVSQAENPVSSNANPITSANEETEPEQHFRSTHPHIDLDQPSLLSHEPTNLDNNEPSASNHDEFNFDDDQDIEALQTMFPASSEQYLQEIRRNNITLPETIDEILGGNNNVNCKGNIYFLHAMPSTQ